MGELIKIGIVGIGYGQHVHLPAFGSDERCEVVAICASSRERARAVSARHGIARAFGDWREMVADPGIDAIAIAVPPAVQVGIVRAAAAARKHVFCEKPVALNVSEARAMLQAVDEARVVHAVDFIFPELAAWKLARQVVSGGELGALRQVNVTWRLETYAVRSNVDSWKLSTESGGGTLNNFVSHCFYYLEWLFGAIQRIAVRLAPGGGAGDVRVDAWLDLAGNLPCTLSVAADAFLGPGHRLEVYGERGTLILENRTSDHAAGFQLMMGTRSSGSLAAVAAENLGGSLRDGRQAATAAIAGRFLDAIATGQSATPNLEDGVRVQALIDAARAAHGTGAWRTI